MLQAQSRETLRSDAEAAAWRSQPRGKDGRFQGAEPWMDKFLEELTASGGNVHVSAELAGVRREWAYICRGRLPEFRTKWNLAVAKARELRIPRRVRPRAN